MTGTVEQLEALLRGTPWDGVPVRETRFSGFRERAFCLQLASPCDDNEWHLLSQLTRRLGLYPVLSRADHVEPGFQVYPPEWEDGSVDSLDEACAQAGRVNGLNFLSTGGALRGPFSPTQTHHMADWLDMPSSDLAHPLNQMRRRFGDSPGEERYGAQLTRCFATTLHLRVARRPGSIDEAFALAIEHRHFASDTFVLPGISLREHARALLTVDRWYFHDRP